MIGTKAIVGSLTTLTLGVAAYNVGGQLDTAGFVHDHDPVDARTTFLRSHPRSRLFEQHGAIRRVYGPELATGATPTLSADQFRLQAAALIDVQAEDLHLGADHVLEGHSLPVMVDPQTGEAKFHVVYYQQVRSGVPVWGSRMSVLVRNEPSHPVVLANTDTRDLGDFQPNFDEADVAGSEAVMANSITERFGGEAEITSTRLVIWAGTSQSAVQPRLAQEAYVVKGAEEWLILTDAVTGEIVHEEFMICFGTEIGSVSGMATEGIAADFCEEEVLAAMPYLRVQAGLSETFTDAAGSFSIDPMGGSVTASLSGMWFDTIEYFGNDLSITLFPPAPLSFVFNQSNLSEQDRAQVNGYLYSNIVRDYALSYNAAYPTLMNTGFPVHVNRTDGFCPGNAWYSPGEQSINFCQSGGSSPNTAWSSVIYHEYGHHLVNAGGSGQGAYGEGMSDVISLLILDSPLLGQGFFGDCGQPLRNADNDCEYRESGCSTCGSGSHACGRLLSACVWDTRQALGLTHPENALEIISNLAINSILLHSGTSIDPGITIDFLTLDDDDGDILNGTPHSMEIIQGFGQHLMVDSVSYTFPNGLPVEVSPQGGDVIRVELSPFTSLPMPGGLSFFADTGSGFEAAAVQQVSDFVYDAVLPPSACGETVRYYFSAMDVNGVEDTYPFLAPDTNLTALSADGLDDVIVDDFESEMGWSVSNSPGLSEGAWERGIPQGSGDRGDPPTDADGSGQCYLTANFDGDSDIDGGSTTLTSPIMNASIEEPLVQYYRWYSNTAGNAPESDVMVVEVSDNGGLEWQELEVVGPDGPEVSGGWILKQFNLNDIPGFNANNMFRIRFTASDLGDGSVVEAAIDRVAISSLLCGDDGVAEDLNEDGVVDVVDLLQLLGAWGPCLECAEDLNDDGTVDVLDLLQLLGAWG